MRFPYVCLTSFTLIANLQCVREYDSLIAWDFHGADVEWARAQAKFLAADLELISAAELTQVNVRKHRVELSMRSVNKGRLVTSLLDSMPQPSFIFTAGDDVTDEAMFRAVHKWETATSASQAGSVVVNVLVGRAAVVSAANFSLPSVSDVQSFIVALYEGSKRVSNAEAAKQGQ